MQRIRTYGRRKLIAWFVIVPISVFILTLGADIFTKILFTNLYNTHGEIVVIDGFFKFNYVKNTGAGFGFLAEVSWGQIFLQILTIVALVLFVLLFYYAFKNKYRFLIVSVALIISGTLGNFIDRIIYGFVTDFISFTFGSYVFPSFNVADICLTVGVTMAIIHFLFIDKEALFKNKKKSLLNEQEADEQVENLKDNGDKNENWKIYCKRIRY